MPKAVWPLWLLLNLLTVVAYNVVVGFYDSQTGNTQHTTAATLAIALAPLLKLKQTAVLRIGTQAPTQIQPARGEGGANVV